MYGGSIMSIRNKKAFTLIEILVVVVIIGILAAIALPQYQKAVERARLSEAISNLKTLAQAEEVYYLQYGEYTAIENLDVRVPNSEYFTYGMSEERYVYASRSGYPKIELWFNYSKASTRNNEWICKWSTAKAEKICRYLGCGLYGDKYTFCVLNNL
jgi:prepilin-type N-terminal cleavage/methylation domain-containing protein